MEGYKTEDPRSKSIKYSNSGRSRFNQEQFDFAPTKFIIDSNYIGEPPHIQVGIVNLNDNINEDFLSKDLSKLGQIRMLQIVRNPYTHQHMGLAKVEFEDTTAASLCVSNFNGKHLMGKQLQVFIDVRFKVIEKIKDNKLHSKPQTTITQLVSPKPTNSVHPNPVLHLNSEYLLVTPSSISSSATATPEPAKRLKLEDRIAQILKKPKYSHNPVNNPTIPPPSINHFKPLNTHHQEPYHPDNRQQHFNDHRNENKPEEASIDEDEDDWNEKPEPLAVTFQAMDEESIMSQVTDYGNKVLDQDFFNVIFSNVMKKLKEHIGFPTLEKSQNAYRKRRDEEKRRAEQERNDRENQRRLERIYMNRYRSNTSQNVAPRPKLNIIRQRMPVADENKAPRDDDSPLAPVNRSSHILLKSEESSIKSSSSDLETISSSESSRESSPSPSPRESYREYHEPEQPVEPEPPVIKQDLLPRRTEEEKNRMLNDLHGSISEEDLKYLKIVHERESEKNKNHEVFHPFGSDYANKTHLKKLVIEGKAGGHPDWWHGCSRCDIINVQSKAKEEEETDYQELTTAPIKSNVIQVGPSSRRDNRGDQRRIAALNADLGSEFIKMYTTNTLQMRAKNLRFSRSKIHKWGLFACEKIANGDAVIEYVGEKIRPSLADHREKNLPTHEGSSYFFRVDHDVIDATLKGNKARFINHSCNPNCIARVIKHDNGSNSIVIYAKQAIQEDEEITYDYKFPREENKIRCMCKAPNCQKYLN